MKETNKNTVKESTLNSPDISSELGRKLEESSASKNIGKVDISSAVSLDSIEVAGGVMGNVSEAMSNNKENSSGGSSSGAKTQVAVDPEIIKKKLLKSIPAEVEMRKTVERQIQKEIDQLHKKAMKLMKSPGDADYYEVSNTIRRIRDLNRLLSTIFKTSFENIKTLWLRFVHGVM